jgi:YfiH family protein
VAHAFSTRRAEGGAAFDLGPADGADPEVVSRRRSFLRASGLGRARPAILKQVHGAAIVDAVPGLELPAEADGAYRSGNAGGDAPVPAVRTADCVAVLLVHPQAKAVAAVHAGWRGAAAGIAACAVSRFGQDGLAACDLVAALGPAILGCCYEVGGEVVSALARSCGSRSGFAAESASGQTTVDLHAALTAQLVDAGVRPKSIHRAPYCTRCRNDLFFSYRGEGSAAGRLMAAVGPAAGP